MSDDRPLNDMTATEVLSAEGRFTNFVRALELSGVDDLLEKTGPYTLFAANDDAFNMETMGGMTSQSRLMDVLCHYVVPGKYEYVNLIRLPLLVTVIGSPIVLKAEDGVTVNGIHIVRSDMPYNKGIIHEIEGVLFI